MRHKEEKCFYNKCYKGWRPSKICEQMGVTYKRRSKFSLDMGGFTSSASEEESSNEESIKSAMNDSDHE